LSFHSFQPKGIVCVRTGEDVKRGLFHEDTSS
jgi:hypothetical protein